MSKFCVHGYKNSTSALNKADLTQFADARDHSKPFLCVFVLYWVELKLNECYIKISSFSAKVIRFNQLLHLLPHGTDPTATLRALQIVAVLVQGCWVVKRSVKIAGWKQNWSKCYWIKKLIRCRTFSHLCVEAIEEASIEWLKQ